jgi:ferredoxin-thioredoxin reductase catalytic subunit
MANEDAIKEWIEKESGEPDIQGAMERYENYASSNGFRLNPDKKAVERIVGGLFKNEKKYGKKYCPCRRVTGNEADDAKIICPCIYHKDEIQKDGHCLCSLYVK